MRPGRRAASNEIGTRQNAVGRCSRLDGRLTARCGKEERREREKLREGNF